MCAQVQLSEYTMTSVTEGIEALASTRVSIRPVGGHADQGFVIHAQVSSFHCYFPAL
jgi:2-isopropylmalate synthase